MTGQKMELRIDKTKKIAYIKLTGTVSKENVLEAFDEAVASEGYEKGMGRLWDFSEIDLSSLDSQSIPEMAVYSLRFPPGIGDVKVAFVVTKTMEYGLTRMFKAYSDSSAKSQVNIFHKIEDAEDWMMKG
ncbi:hypothetical protein ACFL9T_04280 [Thermodesulfobacteriota bacterium]